MQSESPIDTSDDITTNRRWLCEQIDRLLAWEILCRTANNEEIYSIRSSDLCDKIGVSPQYFHHVFYRIKNKVNAKHFDF